LEFLKIKRKHKSDIGVIKYSEENQFIIKIKPYIIRNPLTHIVIGC